MPTIDYSPGQIEQLESLYDLMGEETPEADIFLRCDVCNIKYPQDDTYWYFDGEGEILQPCRECQKKALDAKQDKDLLDAAQTVTEVLPSLVMDKIVKGELVEVSGLEHLRDAFAKVFGGVHGIAKLAWIEYNNPRPNPTRVRILELMAKIVGKADVQAAAKEEKDRAVSDEDIRAVLQAALPKLLGLDKTKPTS